MTFWKNLLRRRAMSPNPKPLDVAELRRRAEMAQEAAFAEAAQELGEAGARYHSAVLRGDTRAQAQHYRAAKRIRRKIMQMEGLG